MRLFIAINLPAPVIGAFDREVEPLRAAAPALRWIAPEKWHLTVRFIGDQPVERVAEIRAAIDAATARHGEAPLSLGGVGAFPNFRRARVIWIGVAPDPRLEMLHHDIETACVALGMEHEGRPFRPHVTIGRVPPGVDEATLRALSGAARRARHTEQLDAGAVDLMASELAPDGPRYRLIHSSPLAAAA
ncbi:MAG: RNA 2',3'-cyclic phosphodiesterase [Gemmatimonadaceae bacterium]